MIRRAAGVALFVIVLGVCAGGVARAQVGPDPLLNYQGVLRDADGAPLDGTYDMVFSFHDAEADGNEILRDSHTGAGAIVVSTGLFNVTLGNGLVEDGSGSGVYGSLAEVFRDYSTVWMAVTIDPNGLNETLSPRVRVLASPYALNADHLDGRDSAGFIDTSIAAQSKAGDLSVGGDVRVGQQIQIEGGSPAAGLVLTSDDVGLATWQPPPTGPQGPTGPEGPEGPQGPEGPPGASVPGKAGQSISVVDSVGDVGVNPDITIGSDGLAVISYFDSTNEDLKLVKCDNATCTSFHFLPGASDSRFAEGRYSCIATDALGRTIVAYLNEGRGKLEMLCVNCGWTAPVDLGASIGKCSLSVGSDGLPVLAHLSGSALEVVHCEDQDCALVTRREIAPGGDWPKIEIGVDGFPVIVFTDAGDMYLAHCLDSDCTTLEGGGLTRIWPANSLCGPPSVVFSPNQGLVIANCQGPEGFTIRQCPPRLPQACGGCTFEGYDCTNFDWSYSTEDPRFVSVAAGADGEPILAYFEGSGPEKDLAVWHRWRNGEIKIEVALLDPLRSALSDPNGNFAIVAAAVGTDGLPIIAYYDSVNEDLKVVHCANEYCIPHVRR